MENNLENFLDKIYENSTINSALCKNNAVVLLPKEVEKEIESSYGNINEGYIFERSLKIEDLKEVVKRLSPKAGQYLYESTYKGVGYDFRLPRKEVVKYKKLIGYKENDLIKEENNREYPVKKSIVPKQKEEFRTNTLSLSIRALTTEQAKRDYPDHIEEAEQDRLFVLEHVHPGRSFVDGKEIPPFSKWNNEYFIVVPEELNG